MIKVWSALDGPWQGEGIAIVGMAGRFPAARNVGEFWRNLLDARDCLARLTQAELRRDGVDESLLHHERFVPVGGVLEDIEWFDAGFFGISPREAESMDPQQRLLLETVQHALDDAGCDPERVPGPIGVYAGSRLSGYWLRLLQHPQFMATMGWHQVAAGNDKDFLATQVSYRFDLRGPSVAVQAACSTSLLAVSLACDGLIAGQCDVAIAGGTSIAVPHRTGYVYQPSGIASPDGRCRPFDANAQGSVLGNGVAVVVLKRLTDAVAAGDRIYAVIRATAVNNDGAAKSSFAAPSVRGQTDVITTAFERAAVTPEDIGYIETHGTATVLGDAIEAGALGKVFGARRSAEPCRIGSVKGNVGHLDSAAGVTSLIKVALSLYHGEIPPSIHFERPNPAIDFAAAGIRVVGKGEPWPSQSSARVAGVSSFGIGGTNVHVVLEEPPSVAISAGHRPMHLLSLSAKTAEALAAMRLEFADYLEANRQVPLDDIAFTLACGRRQLRQRNWILVSDHAQAAAALRRPARSASARFVKDREAFFLFPGQGTQHRGMGLDLYRAEPPFKKAFDDVATEAIRHLGFDLRSLLVPEDLSGGTELNVHHTSVAQPFLFAVEYAMAQLWTHWGISPVGMLGHSIGELVAACISEVFSPADAVRIVCERGRLMGYMEPGSMLAVFADEPTALALQDDDICVSAFNAPRQQTLSGPSEAIASLEERLSRQNIEFRRLSTSHAFHHQSMRPASEQLLQTLRQTRLREPRVPFLSNLTGDWIKPEQATDPEYWAETIVAPVRFLAGLTKLLERPQPILIECGPGRALASIAHSCSRGADTVVVSGMAHGAGTASDLASMLEAAGTVWQAGAPLDWDKLWGDRARQRVTLPSYPFQRQRFWIEGPLLGQPPRAAPPAARRSVRDKCHVPAWQPSEVPARTDAEDSDTWLVLADASGFGLSLCERLQQAGRRAVAVIPAEKYEAVSEFAYCINPLSSDDARRLIAEMAVAAAGVRLVNCWTLMSPGPLTIERAEFGILAGFRVPVTLFQMLLRSGHPVTSFHTITSQLFGTVADEVPDPTFAPAVGIVRVVGQEMPAVRARLIDIPAGTDSLAAGMMTDQVADELLSSATDPIVAYRGTARLTQTFRPASVPLPSEGAKRLRSGGTYLITGGFGGIGSVVAKLLASGGKCNLALVSRRGKGGADNRLLGELEAMGASVLPLAADVSDPAQVDGLVDEVRKRFGPVCGVVHAAGIAGGGMLAARNLDDADAVFAPKIRGTIALLSAVAADRPDFFVVCSSFAAVSGGVGQADYCGANAFLDAFAANARAGGVAAISINWPAWRDVGMAAAMSLPRELESLRQASLASGITNTEGAELFASILAADLPQVVVAPFPVEAPTTSPPAARPRGGNGKMPPPELSVDELQATLTAKVTEIWSRVLGIPEVKADDNFFELGGQSLLALQIIAGVSEQFPVKLDLSDIFEVPVLGAFVALLQARLGAGASQTPQLIASPSVEPPAALPVDSPARAGNGSRLQGPAAESPTDALQATLTAKVAEIWSRVLGIPEVRTDDNFFELGGQSLIALQIVSAVHEQFRVQLDLSDIFENPVLRAFAALVRARLVELVSEMPQDRVREMLTSATRG